MLNQTKVRRTIDAAEESFLKCLEILCQLKAGNIALHDLLEFQPLLVTHLLALDNLYLEASSEKKRLIAEKASLSPQRLKRLKRRLHLLAHYQAILNKSGERGRILGNNFAWLFYCRDEISVHEHLKHEPTSHIPVGVGGYAELDFIEKFALIDNRFLVIYHGMTSFLRIGDVSFIDIKTFRLAGVGELKAGAVEGGQVQVAIGIAGNNPDLKNITLSSNSCDKPQVNLRSPDRFRRQRERMVNLITCSSPADSRRLRLTVDYSALKGALEEALSSGSCFRRIGSSHLVAVTALSKSTSFYARYARSLPEEEFAGLDKISEHAIHLASPFADNALWISKLYLNYRPGATPNFWTRLPTEFIKAAFQQKIAVTILYNPGRFIERLRHLGFTVALIPGQERLSVTRVTEGVEIKVDAMNYFLGLIIEFFVDEITVANAIVDLVDAINPQQYGQKSMIALVPMQAHPIIEDADLE
jgi:hypothetical protein